MDSKPIICEHCGNQLIEYFSNDYNGKRAKCKSCNTDFPLE